MRRRGKTIVHGQHGLTSFTLQRRHFWNIGSRIRRNILAQGWERKTNPGFPPT